MLRTKKRWDSFDAIKGIACIAIVLIHYNFPGDLGLSVKAFSRFGVPVFFIISGFFFMSDGKIDDTKTVRKLLHIFKLAVGSGLFYAVFTVVSYNIVDSAWTMRAFAVEKLTADRIVKFFLTNDPFAWPHLWFLLALLYCYLFALLFMRSEKSIVCMLFSIPVLVVLHNMLQEFGGCGVLKTSLKLIPTDNRLYLQSLFIFRALPFFLFGIFLRRNEERVKKIPFDKIALGVCFVLGGCIAVVERYHFNEEQFYIGNYIMVLALCIYAIKKPEGHNKVLRYIGKELSLYVYILHIAVGKVVDIIAGRLSIAQLESFRYTRAFIIIFMSLVISCLIVTIKQFRKGIRK